MGVGDVSQVEDYGLEGAWFVLSALLDCFDSLEACSGDFDVGLYDYGIVFAPAGKKVAL